MKDASRLAVGVFALLMSFSAHAQPLRPPKKLALLVGIDQYKSNTVRDLHGCVNDIRDFESVLRTTFEFEGNAIKSLPNEKATKAAILSNFRMHLIDNANAGDIVVFYYSGHGSRMRDNSGDETGDGFDETIVPHDSRQGDVFDISDDELNGLVRQLLAKTQNVTVILDSCHSGSGARVAGADVRLAPDDLRTPPPLPADAPRGGQEGESGLRELALDYVLISGARSDQLANEYLTDEGQQRGALSYHIGRVLRGAGGRQMTYRELMESVAASVNTVFPTQNPQTEGLRIDHVVFGSATDAVDPYVLVSPSGTSKAKLQGGSAQGIGVRAEFDVYPPRTRVFTGSSVARLTVTRVRPFEADADLVGSVIEPLSRAVMRKGTWSENPVRIYYDASAAEVAPAVRLALREYPSIAEVTTAAQSSLILKKTDSGLAFHSPDLVQLSPAVPTGTAATMRDLARQALEWSKWFRILSIRNPSPKVSVAFDVREKGRSGVDDVVMDDEIEVTVRNTSNQNLYITIIDLSNDGSSSVWYPPAGMQDVLNAGNELKREFTMWVPDGRSSVTDTIKVFATAQPIDPTLFRLDPVKSTEALPARGPLETFIEERVRGKRGGTPVELGGWTTAERSLTIRRNARALLTNFIAHFEGGRAGDVASVRAALPECRSGPAGPCYEVHALSPDESVVEIIPGGTRGEDAAVEAAAAWEEAYRIRDQSGAARVEPSLEFGIDDFTPDTEGTRGGDGDKHSPLADANPIWSLQHANIPSAWKLLQDKRGRRSGEEGLGIIVGHPDTGYRRHAEIWSADPNVSPILTQEGYDYVRKLNDAEDQLEGGTLANPGHGTKSSSVIVSPQGKQHTDTTTEKYVDGVAPGARLIPLRVHKSVVQFNPARLAKAIYDVSSGSGNPLRKKADVISISMGGVPSWALWKAARFAEKQGVIVVAAAGNKVGLVVWPARFSETIAVTASNVDCGIWSGSSRGPAVDITAPGESVWHASPAQKETVKMGKGTTYATATTAGIAALWLDYHSSDPIFKPTVDRLRRNGEITSAFRNALRNAAWRPDRDSSTWPPSVNCTSRDAWHSLFLGPGIVDAAKTLQQPLSASRAIAPGSLDALPLFGSIFPMYDAGTVAERYVAIFRSPQAGLSSLAIFESEIMQRYALDAEVRTAIDTLATSPQMQPNHAEAVRRALLAQQISARLRTALITPPPHQ
jgi:hypothetical protein